MYAYVHIHICAYMYNMLLIYKQCDARTYMLLVNMTNIVIVFLLSKMNPFLRMTATKENLTCSPRFKGKQSNNEGWLFEYKLVFARKRENIVSKIYNYSHTG